MKPLNAVLSVAAACFMFVSSPAVQAAEETPFAIPGGTYVTPEKAKSLYDSKATFIDARVAVEYEDKHIKGAKNVLFKEEFPKVSKTGPGDSFDIAALPADKNTELVFYCNGTPCWKGYKAAERAIKGGYKRVYWYRDGLPSWAAKGYPTE